MNNFSTVLKYFIPCGEDLAQCKLRNEDALFPPFGQKISTDREIGPNNEYSARKLSPGGLCQSSMKFSLESLVFNGGGVGFEGR